MRVLIALDWSEQAFAAVREVSYLYDLQEVVLVHGIDLGMFQYPIVAEVSNMQGYDEFRQAMERAGQQLLDHTATLLPPQGHPVQALLMFEYERPETSLLPWITSWAAALPAPLRYHQLHEAKLPSWDEVLAVLSKKGASPEAIAALRAFYDELTCGQYPSFEDLANELEAYLG